MKALRSISDWFGEHPWIVTSFLLGIAAGLCLCLPLFPVVLPDTAAQLIGAGLGAGLAVGGAAWVSNSQERRARAALRREAQKATSPIIYAIGRVVPLLPEHSGTKSPLPKEVLQRLREARNYANGTVESLRSLTPAFHIGADTMLLHHQLIEAAQGFAKACELEIKKDAERNTQGITSTLSLSESPYEPFLVTDIDAHAALLQYNLRRL